MIRRPPRSTQRSASAASDVYKRQVRPRPVIDWTGKLFRSGRARRVAGPHRSARRAGPVSYTHLRAHETVLDLVCRLLLEKKKYAEAETTQRHHIVRPSPLFIA